MVDQVERRLAAARRLRDDVALWSRVAADLPLRAYQLEPACAIARSVLDGDGLTFTVLFPRQAGKNELSAQLEAWLLWRYSRVGGSIVKTAPAFRPQLVVSLRRLERLLLGPLTRGARRSQGYLVQLGRASAAFLSGQVGASVVGGTASLLLEGDEAQDLDSDKWGRDFVPMAATGNATRVLYGTPWTGETLLARQVEQNRALQARDGRQRHFEVDWQRVAESVPAYRRHVEGEIARLGESHPIVQTQYLLRTLARVDRLLGLEQLELLEGEHQVLARPGDRPADWGRGGWVAGLDVAGADEEDPDGALVRVSPGRDSTVLAIGWAEDLQAEGPGGVVEPRVRLARLYAWRGAPHRQLYPVVLSLVRELWRCRRVVVDATGVGGGLAAYLGAALGPRVVEPLVYSRASKSELGYGLLAAINARRLLVYADPGGQAELAIAAAAHRRELLAQAAAARRELVGEQGMRWYVPEAEGHDDLINGLALLARAAPLAARRVASGRGGG